MKTLNTLTVLVFLFTVGISSSCQDNTTDNIGLNIAISQDEKSQMLFMLEEEKLAFDVYNYLNEKWSLTVFQNISQSEQSHINSMKALLDSYSIAYSISEEQGFFKNLELKNLYNELISKGQKSELDALQVGKLIEEKDIKDLELAIKSTNNENSINTYNNLLQASYNHLNAFNKNILKY
ncbi:DUF2202 domain-containing protein [Tenacibaculum sp. UWU-22]|uniref:DUF2202 domain-containing protein n=1 Tax=Tenacibaculum sp. UWU-22 TaxID=3234187 RepID=UPI0034DAE073